MRIILFLLFLSNSLLSQSDAAIEKMALYSDIMVNVQHVKHRQMAQDSLYNIFKNWAQQGNTFGQTLDSVEWISVKYPEDHSFRVISWQCEMLKFTIFTNMQVKMVLINICCLVTSN